MWIIHHERMFTICVSWRGFAWTRRSIFVCGYEKTGRLRPQMCMCRPFQNRDSSPFHCRVMQPRPSGVACKWVMKLCGSSKSSGIGGKLTAINSSPSKSRFYAIDFRQNEKKREKSFDDPKRRRNCRMSSPISSLIQIFAKIFELITKCFGN